MAISRAVTAVIPTRNRWSMLSSTLGAVLAQEDVDLEVVVVDEASTDETPERLAALDDPRVRVVRHDAPRRLAGARNSGMEHVRTPWVAFCDDDDLWAPEKLAAQLASIEAMPGARWACVGTVAIDTEQRIVGHHRVRVTGDVADRIRIGNIIPGGGSGVLADVELVREVGLFDPELVRCEDYDMWIRLGARALLAGVDRPLLGYRIWPGTMSTSVAPMREGRAAVLARYRDEGLDPAACRAADLRHRQYLARFHLAKGDRVPGFRDYLDIARSYRLPTHAVHAVAALVSPGLLERWRDRQTRAEIPPAWAAEAEAWLSLVRPLQPATA